jgi:hypothetical protein
MGWDQRVREDGKSRQTRMGDRGDKGERVREHEGEEFRDGGWQGAAG